jgi:uncharacterized protein (DUF2384 family)
MDHSMISRLIDRTIEVFEDEMLSMLWLNTPNSLFEYCTPLSFSSRGSVGVQRVLTILARIQQK